MFLRKIDFDVFKTGIYQSKAKFSIYYYANYYAKSAKKRLLKISFQSRQATDSKQCITRPINLLMIVSARSVLKNVFKNVVILEIYLPFVKQMKLLVSEQSSKCFNFPLISITYDVDLDS